MNFRAAPTDESVRRALRSVVDPELGIDVVELGLVFGITIDGADVRVALATTSPACPLADVMRESAEAAIRIGVPAVDDVVVEPAAEPWSPERMSDRARAALGITGGAA